jgi:hypothetical protein
MRARKSSGSAASEGRSEADEVAEEDAHDLAFLVDGRRRLCGQRCGTEAAELEAVRILLAAGSAGRHHPSLGTQTAQGTHQIGQSAERPDGYNVSAIVY